MATVAASRMKAIHANDPEWIIQLWLAIHGGDPAPFHSTERIDRAAIDIIRSVSTHLDPAKQRAVRAALG